VLPGEQVLGLVGLQKAVTGKVAEYPPSECVLETLEELGCESSGFVDAEAGIWIPAPIIRDLLEASMHNADGIPRGSFRRSLGPGIQARSP